jgi:integrase
MGYIQRVTKKDKRGRITSSWERVRIVVPDGLSSSLPSPYTGKKSLTKKANNEREAAEWTERFLAMLERAKGRTATLRELAELDRLSDEDQIRRVPAVFGRFLKTIDLPVPVAEGTPEPATFESILPKWAKHTNAPKKGIEDRETKCGRFTEYLGHDDMAKVTFENCRDYRDFLIEEGKLEPTSILNHLKALKALFTYAFENDYIPANHMARVKFNPGNGEKREDFSPEERALILTLAREAEPVIYWCNWLSSFEGARLSEITDANTRDIVLDHGVWVMKIRRKYRAPDQRLKTIVSTRDVPLHSAVLAEGFLGYVEAIKRDYGDGPLFPQITLDGYGRRNGKVSKPISKWLRKVVGITDPNKPFYSHRHTATSYLRNTLLPDGSPAVKEDVERYPLGHAGKDVHAGYGEQWIKTLKAAIEIIPNPLEAALRATEGGAVQLANP